jgi:HK97 family phage major capsid protein
MHSEINKKIAALSAKIGDVEARARHFNRPLSAKEAGLVAELEAGIDELRLELPQNSPLTLAKDGPLGDRGRANNTMTGDGRGYALRGPAEAKTYRDLYGAADGCKWEDKSINFFDAVLSGRHHPGLIRAGMSETVPSDGGFLIPTQYAEKIHAVSLENEIIMPRCFVQPMKSNSIKIPAMSIGAHSSNLYGGFTASYVAEAGTITEQNPKVRSMELNAKKLVGLIRFSSELSQDIPGGENQLIQLCGRGLSWYRDRAFLKGSGAGEPLGILNSNCLISVTPETGQTADTIVYENLTKMMSRMFAGSFGNSFWLCHQSTIPQLLTLSVSVGTGGNSIPVMTRSNGGFEILTRPVVFTEKTEKVGDLGDVLLIDASQFVVGLRGEMRFDTSIHPGFLTDEIYARIVERHDAEPLWDSPLTLEDGTTTVSPFVALAERA